ncbi:LuxR family transcriptional regulator [Aeromonas hydrophila]|uniref:response regulator transcription factor n=1 Tax=Aeromonas hydrophila TaxID=644 RepID=UPI000537971A|nr:response regulator transcription factor [Aeromonas hydrophila]KHA54649.1 LuxR family transcriptional regulator [Aeromonas hydrophila]
MKKVLIVDDHPAIRMAVKIILQQSSEYVFDEVDNGVDAIGAAKKNGGVDIVILDVGIPKLDGIEVVKRIKNMATSTKIIILSAQDSQSLISRCLQVGADGFVSKMKELSLLLEAIHFCESGKKYFPAEILRSNRLNGNMGEESLLETLSDREMSVLLALCKGFSNKEIAHDMLLSEKTISTYKARLMQKLNVKNMIDLSDLAKRQGLV